MTCSKDGGGDDASTITDVPPVLLGLCFIGDRLEADSNPDDPSSSRRFFEPKVISHVLSSHGSSSSSSSSLDFSSPSKSPGKQVNLEVKKILKVLEYSIVIFLPKSVVMKSIRPKAICLWSNTNKTIYRRKNVYNRSTEIVIILDMLIKLTHIHKSWIAIKDELI
jgi:hypothetical protein